VHVISCKATGNVREFDKREVSDVKWVSMEEVQGMIARRELTDGLTLTTLFLCEGGPFGRAQDG